MSPPDRPNGEYRRAQPEGTPMSPTNSLPAISAEAVREQLRARREVALIDVREEDPFAQQHPLFAAQLSAGRIELDAPWRLPRRDAPIVVYDDGEGLAVPAALRLQSLGYSQVHLLDGGLAGWRDSGGELFRDVNVPSKAFGELVEHEVGTPSLPAEEVKALLDAGTDLVVLDARRFDEYHTMSIPQGTSVPGAELVLRVRDLAPNPATRVIVNCAGRTRSLIGAQSLVNAGIPNPVAALRNGTIGWTLAGFALEQGQARRFGAVAPGNQALARAAAQSLADRAGAIRLDAADLARWAADTGRTLYCWDVRTPEEYAAGHLPGFGSAPGGQLVQETDVFAAVRGARLVLADDDGVRAPMTAHWLAQLGWEVAWLTETPPGGFTEIGAWRPAHAALPAVQGVSAPELQALLARQAVSVIDLNSHAQHAKGHVPGAWWALRSQLGQALQAVQTVQAVPHALPQNGLPLVLTCSDGRLSRFAALDLRSMVDQPVQVLDGGTAAWVATGLPLETGAQRLASPAIDRYRRPYEGTDNPRVAMQAYLDWEYGLVAQLARDGTHCFRVLAPEA